jgi:hypothetical protein
MYGGKLLAFCPMEVNSYESKHAKDKKSSRVVAFSHNLIYMRIKYILSSATKMFTQDEAAFSADFRSYTQLNSHKLPITT